MLAAVLLASVGGLSAVADEPGITNPTGPASRFAEVTADDVYVRSGPSLNHYPVLKLQAGQRVQITGEEGPWLQIVPPEGAISLISENFVDTADDQHGVVNGDRVNVRAASNLPEWKGRRSPQTQLSRGAEVEIIQRLPDGYLEIKPPASARLWISSEFVTAIPARAVAIERQMNASLVGENTPATGSATGVPTAPSPAPTATESPAALAMGEATPQRVQLQRLDSEVKLETAKPIAERNFTPFIEQYQQLSTQEDDTFAQQYAGQRLAQLQYLQEVTESVRRVRSLVNRVENRRRVLMEERANLPTSVPPVPGAFDVQGEVRVSAAYPPGSHPERYRLVDPSGTIARTIGYLEIPADSGIVGRDFVGRYVGVRAAGRKRLPGGNVDVVPIYVVGELVPLQPTSADAEPNGEPSDS